MPSGNTTGEYDNWYRNPAVWRRAVAVAALAGVIAVAVASDGLHDLLLRLFESASRAIASHPVAGVVLFIVLSALSAMLAFVSSAVLIPVALGIWGKWLCMLLLWIGWMLGGLAAYSVARWLGRPVVERLSSGSALQRYEARINDGAPFSLVLLFQLALPSELPGYILGLARYRLGRYALALAIAELPYAVGAVYLGAGFMERKLVLLGLVGAAGIAAGAVLLRALHHRLRPAPLHHGTGQVEDERRA